MINIPALGVGITYSADLEELIIAHPNLFPVLEIEPQTLWMETRKAKESFRVFDTIFEKIASLPAKKLVHSVGAPVGGTVLPDKKQFDLLRKTVDILKAPYASEHLSFNATHGFNTGFFLPPRQTAMGVKKAVESIKCLQDIIGVPLAVETGVNYFKLRSDEMPDGEFVSAVADASGCGILLDLHNLFANQVNGRQSIPDFLQQIPLERVWEVHLAGGFEMDGYYLDSHSGEMPIELLEISRGVISKLPNLKAIIFEVFPSFIPLIGLDTVKNEMEKIHTLWELRGTQVATAEKKEKIDLSRYDFDNNFQPDDWEYTIGKLAVGHSTSPTNDLEFEMQNDPAIPLVQKLIHEFRASMLVAVLPLTSRLIILTLQLEAFMSILENFWSKYTPKLYAASEAENFIEYLEMMDLKIPSLQKVLEFEKSVLQTLMDDKIRVVKFDFNPFPILESLGEGKLPENDATFGDYEIEITPTVYEQLSANGQYDFTASFPFH
jgi:uncharacterized protein (UPF0276 family)